VEPLNVADYEALAAARLDPGALAFFAGGAGDEVTLRDNVAAFGRWQLRPRVLRDVASPSTATTVLGHDVAVPLLVAPIGYLGTAHPDGEPGMARAAHAAGTIMCLSTFANTPAAEVTATGARCWYQLYVPQDDGLARELRAQAAELGFGALVVTVDLPVSGRRERDLRSGWVVPAAIPVFGVQAGRPHDNVRFLSPSLTWRDVEGFAADTRLPVVLKGILTAEDAILACEHGAAAIVVSNHGGRQLDGVPAAIDVLPEIVDAVGDRIEVYVDGGIRRGTDVLKALALGARAVLVGRAPLWGLAAGGGAGAAHVLELLRAEVQLGLQLLGCRTPREVERAHVARPPR
jgi:isopentenyl diphosphate isomerase/L-lactate dehydrogenase-like FMN-dependent dehydrogenase